MELGATRRLAVKKFFTLFVFLFFAPAFAEISSLNDSENAIVSDENKIFLGFEANNILLLEDGSLYFSFHGGVKIHPQFRLGMYAATVANDVNSKEHGKKISVDYNSLGILAEYKPLQIGNFSLSIPVTAGAGFTSINTKGEEHSKAKDGYFVADAALHFNYQINPSIEIGIGGGYRVFLGISEDDFENSDFNTPFGAFFINWGER